jgi:hypothetical protein
MTFLLILIFYKIQTDMKKIFSFKDFSKREVNEAIDPAALRGAWSPEELGTYTGVDDEDPIDPVLSSTGSITLKREDFDVIVRPQDDGGGGPPPPPGGPPPPPPPPQPRYKKKIEIVKIKDKKKKREEDAERLKRGQKKRKEGEGDKESDKQPPKALPKVGDKVILQDGTKKIVKKVLPNGDIEV